MSKRIKVVVDRFEGEYAILMIGDPEEPVDFPQKLLPKGTKEGSWLWLDFELDPKGEAKQREKMKKLMDKLVNKHTGVTSKTKR